MKMRLSELALLGGPPAFPEKLHVGRPNIGDRARLLARIGDMLDRRWLTNDGPYVVEFEKALAGMLGVKYCLAICNATVALEIAIRALGMSGEVIVPAFTFVATAHALQWQRITPVFCDVDPHTHNLDPEVIERMLTPRTSGILGVHVWGRPCAVEQLADLARRHNLRLLFDAAHAFGCSHHGQMIGGFGDAEVFSFHATKFFNTFEGGAIATNDGELARRVRLMRNFGFSGYDEVTYVGTNGKMSEPSAAMGLTGLESLDAFVAANRHNYERYRHEIGSLPGVRQVVYDDSERCNYQYIVLEIDEGEAGLSRDEMQQVLWAENVLARRYFYPGCHRMEPYRSYFPNAGLLLPETERLVGRCLSLPNGTAVGPAEIAVVCGIIRLAVTHSEELRDRLRWEARPT